MKALALGLAVALVSGAVAGAFEEQHFGSFSVYSDEPELIYLDGSIELGAADDFMRARRAAPEASTLVLASDGGHVDEAEAIARQVRGLGLATYVPLQSGCYSACAYIFFAGVDRRATGQLGVHQVSDPGFTALSLQRDLADLLDLLFEFGVDTRIATAMLRTPPEALYVLDGREIAQLGVDVDGAQSLDWLDERFGYPFSKWSGDAADACQAITAWSGGYEVCVPAAWIPTSPEPGETYYYQDAEHRMGLLIRDEPGDWTRDELRDIVLDAAAAQSGDRALQELQWPVAGGTFDLMIYPGLRNGSEVLYQHFYRVLPEGGGLQVLVYSAAGQAWQASSLAAQLFSHLRIDDADPAPAAPRIRMRDDRRSGTHPREVESAAR